MADDGLTQVGACCTALALFLPFAAESTGIAVARVAAGAWWASADCCSALPCCDYCAC